MTPHRRKIHFASAGDRCAALLDGQHQTPQVLGPNTSPRVSRASWCGAKLESQVR
jgi:hypothetical protein